MYHLRSVAENVLQMLGVGGKLSEELPVAFDVVELLSGGRASSHGRGQAVRADDRGAGVASKSLDV